MVRRGATLGMFHTVVEEMVAGKVRVALSSRVLALAPGAPSLPGQGASRADRINSARSGILGDKSLLSLLLLLSPEFLVRGKKN